MKIISGKFRGRNLIGPKNDSIRPTSYRAKEMIFSTLNSLLIKNNKNLKDLIVLDCFCGTGALGLEALSRGAKKVIFIDNSEEALKICKENCNLLKINKYVEIIKLDIIKKPFNKIISNINIFFCDPPYKKFSTEYLLDKLISSLDADAIGIIELPKEPKKIKLKSFDLLAVKFVSQSQFYFIKKN